MGFQLAIGEALFATGCVVQQYDIIRGLNKKLPGPLPYCIGSSCDTFLIISVFEVFLHTCG
jgi:hypothetical protein